MGSPLRSLAVKPILTVSDIPDFAGPGGMISLVRNGNRMGFAIDPGAAGRVGIRMRAALLDLAEIVGR